VTLPVIAEAAQRIRVALPSVATYDGPCPDRIDGTGTSVIEVFYGGTWGPTPNNARHSIVHVNILSDRTRDVQGLPTRDDADARCWSLWEVVDALFNDAGHEWESVHSSRRESGPALTLIPNGDRSVMLTARYEISHN